MKHWKLPLFVIVVVVAALVVVYVSMPAPTTEPVTLHLDGDIQQVDIDYSWSGFGPLRHDHYQVMCTNSQCTVSGQRAVIRSYGKVLTGTTLIPSHIVPFETVQDFGNSLIALRPTSGPKGFEDICEPKCFIYALESYPSFHIVMTTTQSQIISIRNGSNLTGPDFTDLAPWNIQLDGQWYFQTTGEIPESYKRLAHTIDPDYSYPLW